MTPTEFRATRLRLGLTQAELATQLGYAQAHRISEIERGQMGISHVLERLMRAYEEGYRPFDWPQPEEA